VQIRDTRTGKLLTPPLKQDGRVAAGAKFNNDESRVLTWWQPGPSYFDKGGVRLWDSRTGETLTPLFQHDGWIKNAKFNADESQILAFGIDGTVQQWDVSVTKWPANKIALRTEVETGTKLTSTGELQVLSAAAWQQNKWCEYDEILHDLKRTTPEQWKTSQRLCEQLKKSQKADLATSTPPSEL
jgi:WD40 repeat protein